MQWIDEGIILGSRKFGEQGALLEVFTHQHGRLVGMLPGGGSRKKTPFLQSGNSVQLTWRARLEEHMGTFQIEPLNVRSGTLFSSPLALHGCVALCALLRSLPERDPHKDLFEEIISALDAMGDYDVSPFLFLRLELSFLSSVGFGLDLSECAATGTTENLIYVSPRTGRAVSSGAGEPYKDRLLHLPSFLIEKKGQDEEVMEKDLKKGFDLTGYFLKKCVFEPRGVDCPRERERFVALALQKR